MARRARKLRWWILGGVALVVVLGVGGPFIYIHLIEGPAPKKLSLPSSSTAPGSKSRSSASSTASIAENWKVGSGSVAGYRVEEVLLGQQATAVGRTEKIWGSLTIASNTATAASFTVDMASVTSNESERNAQFDGRIMDVVTYPTATFILTKPIDLGSLPATGTRTYSATGTLKMHGVTKTVNFPVSAERLNGRIDALADVPIAFSKWNIANPSISGFVTTHSSGTLEVLLSLTTGAGNPTSNTGSSSTAPGGNAPPLSVPKS